MGKHILKLLHELWGSETVEVTTNPHVLSFVKSVFYQIEADLFGVVGVIISGRFNIDADDGDGDVAPKWDPCCYNVFSSQQRDWLQLFCNQKSSIDFSCILWFVLQSHEVW